jgi:hypothetical protein
MSGDWETVNVIATAQAPSDTCVRVMEAVGYPVEYHTSEVETTISPTCMRAALRGVPARGSRICRDLYMANEGNNIFLKDR